MQIKFEFMQARQVVSSRLRRSFLRLRRSKSLRRLGASLMPNILVRLEKKREKNRNKSNFIIEMSETLQGLLAFSLSIISVLCNILGLFNKRTFCTFVFIELHLLGNHVSSSQSFPLWSRGRKQTSRQVTKLGFASKMSSVLCHLHGHLRVTRAENTIS